MASVFAVIEGDVVMLYSSNGHGTGLVGKLTLKEVTPDRIGWIIQQIGPLLGEVPAPAPTLGIMAARATPAVQKRAKPGPKRRGSGEISQHMVYEYIRSVAPRPVTSAELLDIFPALGDNRTATNRITALAHHKRITGESGQIHDKRGGPMSISKRVRTKIDLLAQSVESVSIDLASHVSGWDDYDRDEREDAQEDIEHLLAQLVQYGEEAASLVLTLADS